MLYLCGVFNVFKDHLTLIDDMNTGKFLYRAAVAIAAALTFQPFYAAAIKITNGPWLTDMSESGVTVIWKTDKPALSWVEYGELKGDTFYSESHPRAYDVRDGRRSVMDTLHCVRIEGLKPGTEYFYRLFSRETVKYGDYGRMEFGRTIATSARYDRPTHFRTFSPDAATLRFAVLNDMHERPELIRELCSGVDFSGIDFVLLNGDMLSTVKGDTQVYEKFIDACVDAFAQSVPIVYTRGNHETRGVYSDKLSRYFPNRHPEHQYYWSFNAGDVNFIILDCGEDKPDDDFEYSGMSEYDAYREREAQWLKEEMAKGGDRNTRIVALHIPPMAGNWHGNLHLRETILPLLNEAGVDLMISGHIHRHKFIEPSESQRFPNLINDNASIMVVEIKDGKITADISGKTVARLEIN